MHDVLLHFFSQTVCSVFLQTLEKLYLANTEIGDDGAHYLANALQRNQVIIIPIYLASIISFTFLYRRLLR